MKNAKKIRFFSDISAAIYIAICFFKKKKLKSSKRQTVVFSRGAFHRDVYSMGGSDNLVIIRSEWLRRIFRLGVADVMLEQVICLSNISNLRKIFPISQSVFKYFCNSKNTRIVYGGVDYFEVAIFANSDLYNENVSIDAVFHENYAIEYVKNVNFKLYKNLKNRIKFKNLFTYGPPATEILSEYTYGNRKTRPMVMPRLAKMEDDKNFFQKLMEIDRSRYSKNVLLLAFPGSEYLAPLCFSSTLFKLAESGADGILRPIIKFKNKRSAKEYIKQIKPLDRFIEFVTIGSVEELVWKSGFAIVFNSISLYEALLGPSIVLIPKYLDSAQDENLLQENEKSMSDLRSVLFINSPEEIVEMVKNAKSDEIIKIVENERLERKKIVARKFYLSSKLENLNENI